MTKGNAGNRAERVTTLRWVPISMMRVSPVAQRELNQARVNKLAANFDLEQLGTPTVSKRDGWFYIVDGQHRIAALKEIGWGDQQVQCWTYEGLTEAEEAEKWLVLNDVLTQSAYDKFARGVVAGREKECDIDRIVRAQGLAVSRNHNTEGAISAVGTLTRIYDGSVSGLMAFAYKTRAQMHQSLAQSVAAAAVDVINAGRGGKKLPSWFREDAA